VPSVLSPGTVSPVSPLFLFLFLGGGGKGARTTRTLLFFGRVAGEILDCSLFLSLFRSLLRFSQRARRLLASGVQIIRRLLLPLLPPSLDVAGNISRDYIRVITIIIIIIIIII